VDAPQFALRQWGEVEQDQRQVAITDQQVGGLQCVAGLAAADPQQPRTLGRGKGIGIKAIAGVDQGERRIGY
jgi:hypothetical protein